MAEEFEDMRKRYAQYQLDQAQQELSENAGRIAAFQSHCENLGITLTSEHFSYVDTIGIVATYPDIVTSLCDDLRPDKDGLLDFGLLTTHYDRRFPCSGFLYADNFMLMAHPYFRRGYHEDSNFAPHFVLQFWQLNLSNHNLEPAIAIDADRVRINIDSRAYREFDTWMGASFKEDIVSIPDGIVKHRPPLDIGDFMIGFLFADTYSLDIKWSTKDGIKTFQAEEFKNEKVTVVRNGIEYFPSRYIHAQFDLELGKFVHFDGAIHFYTLDDYCARIDEDFNYNAKHNLQIKSDSMKLFRINGIIETETWINFTSHFFTGDPLIFEYFEGKFSDRLVETLAKIRNRNNNA